MDHLKILNNETIKLLDNNNLLEPLIRNELIKKLINSVKIPEINITELKNQFLLNQKIKSEDEFTKWLEKNKLTEEKLLDSLSTPMRINKYCLEKYGHMAESRFLLRKTELDQIVYSLIRTKDSFLSNELFLRINSNEDTFGEVAKKYSEGEERHTQGIVGPTTISKSHPKLSSLLQKSVIGEINQPIKINDFYIIVRLESIMEATLDKNMEINMAREIFEEWLTEKTNKYSLELTQKIHPNDTSPIGIEG